MVTWSALDTAYLLHVPTTAVFGVDELGLAVIEAFRERGGRDVDAVVAQLADRYAPDRVRAFTRELTSLHVLQPSGALKPINPSSAKLTSAPLSTIVLNVNTGCNLAAPIATRKTSRSRPRARRMDFETAARSVDMLLQAAAQRERINVVFFGGEPLTNVPLIREVVAYAEAAVAAAGKKSGLLTDHQCDAARRQTSSTSSMSTGSAFRFRWTVRKPSTTASAAPWAAAVHTR